MNELQKQAGYLKGLLAGMQFDDPATERLLKGVTELLGSVVDRLDAADELIADLNDYVESIDNDLTDLEHDIDEGAGLLPGEEREPSEPMMRVFPGGKDADVPSETGVSMCPSCGGCFRVDNGTDSLYTCPDCGETVPYLAFSADRLPLAERAER